MGKRKKKKRLSIEKPVGDRKWDFIVSAFFLGGLGLCIWEVHLFRQTMISVIVPLCLLFIPGIVLTPIFFRKMNDIDGRRGHWILHYIFHSFSTGALMMFTFMALNFYLAGDEVTSHQFDIQSKSSIPGSRHHRSEREPTVAINYWGFDKELVFHYEETEEVEKATKVRVVVRDGLFGFDVIDDFWAVQE
jgi:hypothetical protein